MRKVALIIVALLLLGILQPTAKAQSEKREAIELFLVGAGMFCVSVGILTLPCCGIGVIPIIIAGVIFLITIAIGVKNFALLLLGILQPTAKAQSEKRETIELTLLSVAGLCGVVGVLTLPLCGIGVIPIIIAILIDLITMAMAFLDLIHQISTVLHSSFKDEGGLEY